MSEELPILNYSALRYPPLTIQDCGDRVALHWPPEPCWMPIAAIAGMSLLGIAALFGVAWALLQDYSHWFISVPGALLVWGAGWWNIRSQHRYLAACRRGEPSMSLYLTSAGLQDRPPAEGGPDRASCVFVVSVSVVPGPLLLSLRHAPMVEIHGDLGEVIQIADRLHEADVLDLAHRLRQALRLDACSPAITPAPTVAPGIPPAENADPP